MEEHKVVYESIDHKYSLANSDVRIESVNIVGDRPVKNDAGEMSMREEAKHNTGAAHMKGLSTLISSSDLSNIQLLEGPPITLNILTWSGLQIRVRIGKLFSSFFIQNICCVYSKELSQ